MQPLGSSALIAAYNKRVSGSHDYRLAVDVLDTAQRLVSPATLLDGQVNIQADGDVRRTCTLTLLDPDHALNLDAGSVWEGALFADRMVRVRHTVDVPGFGDVTCVPFVGPIAKLSRDGSEVTIECHDKTAFSVLGCPPMTYGKGADVIAVIRGFLASRTGEAHFRFPASRGVRLNAPVSVGWADEASVWAVCQRLARQYLGMQLFYSCDGYATLRTRPASVFEFGPDMFTTAPTGDHDFAALVNYARATAGSIVRAKAAPTDHPLAPAKLGRNGVPRYFPSVEDLSAPSKPGLKKPSRKSTKKQRKAYSTAWDKYAGEVRSVTQQAQAFVDTEIANGLPMSAALTASTVPVFHLDVDDPITFRTDDGSAVLSFSEASIPLISGEASIGTIRRVSRPRRMR